MVAVMFSSPAQLAHKITDIDSFCEWAASPEFPRSGRFSFINDTVWVDLTMEQPFTHNRLRLRIATVLETLVTEQNLGYLFDDRLLYRNDVAGLATEPDLLFVAYESIKRGRFQMIEAVSGGYREVDGTPDMVVEVVSQTSVRKDTVDLRRLYWLAGIPEYWIVDARTESVEFEILKRGTRSYLSTRKASGGWLKSNVFRRLFRLKRKLDQLGNPQFELEMKP